MSDLGPVRFNMFQVLSQVRSLLASPGDLTAPATGQSGQLSAANLRNMAASAGFALPTLENEQTTRLLKDALKWPNEMREMLTDLAQDDLPAEVLKDAKKSLKTLLQQLPQDGSLGLETLADKMEKQTQTGMDRLMKLVQGGALAQGKGGAQVAELASTLGQLAEQVRTSPQQATRVLILMALPWVPLPPPLELDVSWEDGSGDGEGGEEDVTMVIYLQTNTLGRFKLTLQQLKPLQIAVETAHEPHAKPILPTLEERLNEHLASEGLPAAIVDHIEIAKPVGAVSSTPAPMDQGHFKGATRAPNRQEVQMQKSARVSVLVLNCAYFLARTLFELDTQNQPLSKKN